MSDSDTYIIKDFRNKYVRLYEKANLTGAKIIYNKLTFNCFLY